MGIVHAEDADALLRPVDHDAFKLFPELPPVLRLEVQGVDILVFLRGVFRVLDRAVRPPEEPLRVFFNVGMVRRALEGDIQGDFDIVFCGFSDQVPEILQRAQLGD